MRVLAHPFSLSPPHNGAALQQAHALPLPRPIAIISPLNRPLLAVSLSSRRIQAPPCCSCSNSSMATILQSFLRCGRNGKITKIVREHYLRDDIFCGLDGCTLCSGNRTRSCCEPIHRSSCSTAGHRLTLSPRRRRAHHEGALHRQRRVLHAARQQAILNISHSPRCQLCPPPNRLPGERRQQRSLHQRGHTSDCDERNPRAERVRVQSDAHAAAGAHFCSSAIIFRPLQFPA